MGAGGLELARALREKKGHSGSATWTTALGQQRFSQLLTALCALQPPSAISCAPSLGGGSPPERGGVAGDRLKQVRTLKSSLKTAKGAAVRAPLSMWPSPRARRWKARTLRAGAALWPDQRKGHVPGGSWR
eukprot:11841752-Alexandrium_andersonii.AAC.1